MMIGQREPGAVAAGEEPGERGEARCRLHVRLGGGRRGRRPGAHRARVPRPSRRGGPRRPRGPEPCRRGPRLQPPLQNQSTVWVFLLIFHGVIHQAAFLSQHKNERMRNSDAFCFQKMLFSCLASQCVPSLSGAPRWTRHCGWSHQGGAVHRGPKTSAQNFCFSGAGLTGNGGSEDGATRLPVPVADVTNAGSLRAWSGWWVEAGRVVETGGMAHGGSPGRCGGGRAGGAA